MPLDPVPSDFLIFVDESGDHSLTSIDPQYPLFVLTFVVMRKSDYANVVVPSVMRLKYEFFGHDMAVLHSHDIRKPKGDFTFLLHPEKRARFIDRLNEVIRDAPLTIIGTVIRKIEHARRYSQPHSPYDLALRLCMERAFSFLWDEGQKAKLTTIVAESRGRAEDAEFELEFGRICRGVNYWGMPFELNLAEMPFGLRFAHKQSNTVGLQLADLIAHPIGRHVLKPDQPNRAFDVLRPKFLRGPEGEVKGWGLKIFP